MILQSRQEYKTVNGCTKQFECEQIFWAFSMVAIISSYSVFIVPPIVRWNCIPMIVFMALAYLLCLLMGFEYLKLTVTDPVDERITGKTAPGETKYCSRCNVEVGVKTFHCLKCKRCTDELDHHSVLVNNCVSLKQIWSYLRLNICFVLILSCISVESLVVFGFSFNDDQLSQLLINKWIVLTVGFCSGIAVPVSLVNLVSSLYIRFIKNSSKVEYFYRENASNHSDIESSQKIDSAHSVKSPNLDK